MTEEGSSEVTDVQVIIIGAGPTGLIAANLLGQAGISTLLLERNSTLYSYPRAIAIDDEGLRICQAAGLWEEIFTELIPDPSVYYLSPHHLLAKVAPTEQRNGFPLVSTLHQPDFEALLLAGLQRFPHVTVRFGQTLEQVEQDEQAVTLTVRHMDQSQQRLTCAYLLACDGGKSTVRRAINIPLHSVGFGGRSPQRRSGKAQRWLVVDCVEEQGQEPEILFFCYPQRPAVTLPAPGRRRRWEFMVLPGEQATDLQQEEAIQKLIAQTRQLQQQTHPAPSSQRAPLITRQAVYTFHESIASRFRQGRVFLLGDAAHLMPPFGGQGMNSGLRDAQNLCWKLALVLQQRTTPELLSSYEQERAPHGAQMILFSSLLGNLIMPTSPLIAALRTALLRIAMLFPTIRSSIQEMRVKPQPRYRRGFLHTSRDRLVGTLLPQPYVQVSNGQRVLLDELLGSQFALLCLGGAEKEHAYNALNALPASCSSFPLRLITIFPAGYLPHALPPETESAIALTDSEGRLSNLWGRRKGRALLIRPDRYIYAVLPLQCDSKS